MANIANDSTILDANKDMKKNLTLSEKESEVPMKWFKETNTVANPGKFKQNKKLVMTLRSKPTNGIEET